MRWRSAGAGIRSLNDVPSPSWLESGQRAKALVYRVPALTSPPLFFILGTGGVVSAASLHSAGKSVSAKPDRTFLAQIYETESQYLLPRFESAEKTMDAAHIGGARRRRRPRWLPRRFAARFTACRLTEAEGRRPLVVVRVACAAGSEVERLCEMGLTTGCHLQVLRRGRPCGDVLVQVGDSRLCVGWEAACCLWVEHSDAVPCRTPAR
jgi:Fe2+ transport system protein FeoA